jgi:5-amino-6-(5-phosphoribosylamino)uracil reductase
VEQLCEGVSVCVAMSADGKLAGVSRANVRLASDRDLYRLYQLLAQSDAVVMGAETVRRQPFAVRVRPPELLEYRRSLGKPDQPTAAIISGSLDLPLTAPIFSTAVPRALIFTTARVSTERMGQASQVAEVVVAGDDVVDPRVVVERLQARGARRILLEGGGELIFQFVAADLVDDWYITLAPLIVGGRTAPTPCDGVGFPEEAFRHLSLVDSRQEGDELFLHYRLRR